MAKICVLLYLLLTVIKSQVEGCVETFPHLLNSITVCFNLTKQCTVSCVENHIYYDGDITKTYSCNDDNIWSPFVPKTGCLDQTRAIFWMRFNVSYRTTEVAAFCLQAHQQALIDNEDVLTQQVSLSCNNTIINVGRISINKTTSTTSSFKLSPGYSGDHEQTFYIEYRARRTETWSLKEISHNTKQLTSLTYVLSGLQDSTLYELKMYSKNRFGRSLSTDIDIIQTREKQEKAIQETSSSGLYAVIGGMAGVIAVLVIIVIILKRKKGCSSGARINISNRSDNIDEMFSPNRTTSDMYEEIREDTSGTRNEDLQQRGGNTTTTTYEMLAMQDIPNTYGDLSSEQEQRQSESTTEQYETLGEQDKPNIYEQIKNKEEPEDREYINLQL